MTRSAPLPTSDIARRMAEDEHREEQLSVRRYVRQHPTKGGRIPMKLRCVREVMAEPKSTDNGQCWTEEIFSLL